MSINYIIATYSGIIPSRTEYFAGKELQIHLQALVNIFEMKQIIGRKNYISNVTVIMPKVDGFTYPEYYKQQYWLEYFKVKFPVTAESVGIILSFVEKIYDNTCISYDQWIQGAQSLITDYHIFIEDDWMPDNVFFDEELISVYKHKFPDNIGYLCQSCKTHDLQCPYHASISNGIISSDTVRKLGPDWRENMIKIIDFYHSIQLQFSISLTDMKIPLADLIDIYNTPFWASYKKELVFHSQKSKNLFVPIQYYLDY